MARLVLPERDANPASAVVSLNLPLPSLTKQCTPAPSVATSKSRSPSPSISAKIAPVEWRLAQDVPEPLVTSSKRQLPRFRYSRLVPLMAQKYKSHQPSPSKSPAATPEPFNRL